MRYNVISSRLKPLSNKNACFHLFSLKEAQKAATCLITSYFSCLTVENFNFLPLLTSFKIILSKIQDGHRLGHHFGLCHWPPAVQQPIIFTSILIYLSLFISSLTTVSFGGGAYFIWDNVLLGMVMDTFLGGRTLQGDGHYIWQQILIYFLTCWSQQSHLYVTCIWQL